MYTFPLFRINVTFPPIFAKFVHIPYVHSIYAFWVHLRFFLPPYFDHDTFMHHALHVLDAPASGVYRSSNTMIAWKVDV